MTFPGISKFFSQTENNLAYGLGVILILSAIITLAYLYGTPRVIRIMNAFLWLGSCTLFLQSKRYEGARLKQLRIYTMIVISCYAVFYLLNILYENIINPHEWDFLEIYIQGNMAVSGINFYNVANYELTYNTLTLPIEATEEFRQEIFQVGFKYFPPFIFLVLPTGFFDYNTAQIIWFTINFSFLVASAVLVSRNIFKSSGNFFPNFLFAFSIIVLFPPIREVFYYHQSHAIILFLAITILTNIDKIRVGTWVALCSFVKPFGAMLGLIFLLRAKWQTILAGVLTGVLGVLLVGILFGFETLESFIFANPNLNVPNWQYVQAINQSLSATVLRFMSIDLNESHPLLNSYVLITIAFFTVVSSYLIIRVQQDKLIWAFALSLLLAVLIYPGTLSHYSIYLLVPIFLLLVNKETVFSRMAFKIGALALILIGLKLQPILANLFCWLIVAFMTYHFRKKPSPTPVLNN